MISGTTIEYSNRQIREESFSTFPNRPISSPSYNPVTSMVLSPLRPEFQHQSDHRKKKKKMQRSSNLDRFPVGDGLEARMSLDRGQGMKFVCGKLFGLRTMTRTRRFAEPGRKKGGFEKRERLI
jgi:hypothetical protein